MIPSRSPEFYIAMLVLEISFFLGDVVPEVITADSCTVSAQNSKIVCKKIDHLLRRGVLVDWGYAVPVALPSTPIDDSFLGNGPPTSPIEPIGVSDTPSNYIPVVNVGLRDESTS